jgi:hypothetical protein
VNTPHRPTAVGRLPLKGGAIGTRSKVCCVSDPSPLEGEVPRGAERAEAMGGEGAIRVNAFDPHEGGEMRLAAR